VDAVFAAAADVAYDRSMATARSPAWFWAHDARPDHLDSLTPPGFRLVRLASYGHGPARRFAALSHEESGAARAYHLDLDQKAVEACSGAVSITVDDEQRFSVVVEEGYASRVRVGLSEAQVQALSGVADIAMYVVGRTRRYAVVEDGRESRVLMGATMSGLKGQLRKLGAVPFRLRDDAGPWFTAVVSPAARATWSWYAGLEADEVAEELHRHHAHPVDLDAVASEDGVTFTVIMYR
jgi:hypothetical protein